jgi:hypothetical protein
MPIIDLRRLRIPESANKAAERRARFVRKVKHMPGVPYRTVRAAYNTGASDAMKVDQDGRIPEER